MPRCSGSIGLEKDPLLSLGGAMGREVAEGQVSSLDWPCLMCSLALLTAALQLVPLLTVLPAEGRPTMRDALR